MGVMRSVLLAGSQNEWLKTHAPRWGFVRRAVTRFMPGEHVDDAVRAARGLSGEFGIGSVFTRLGENLAGVGDADEVAAHYLDLYDRIARERLDIEISVKPTQLGLDFDKAVCLRHLEALAERAGAHGNWLWVDMESTAYTDVTLEMFHHLRARHAKVGLCIQAYLHRTKQDLERLVATGSGVRLVKGAYLEPKSLAFPAKRDVDENYFALAQMMIGEQARNAGVRAIFGTHDPVIIRRIEAEAARTSVPRTALEFQMLYGIQRGEQQRLAASGSPFRVLVAYGDAWFAWYMRRLAERPANVTFVLKNVLSG